VNSEKRQHFSEPAPGVRQKSFEPSTEVGIRYTLQEDLYIVYAGSVAGTEEAVYRFTINPLVVWVWIGGVVLVIGGLITMWPGGVVSGAPRQKQAGYEVQLAGSGAAE
jgi:cytochrome c-type biogenesis protein CcmF